MVKLVRTGTNKKIYSNFNNTTKNQRKKIKNFKKSNPLITFKHKLSKQNESTIVQYQSNTVTQDIQMQKMLQHNNNINQNLHKKIDMCIKHKIHCNKSRHHTKQNATIIKRRRRSISLIQYQNALSKLSRISKLTPSSESSSLVTHFSKLNHVTFNDMLDNVAASKIHGPYSDDHESKYNTQLNRWLHKGISKEINVCTVTRENENPIIKTGIRYNTTTNREKINFILNHTQKDKIQFDPHQVTYGIKIGGSGTSMGLRHHECISTIYNDNNSKNDFIKSNIKNKAYKKEYTVPTTTMTPSSILQQVSLHPNTNTPYLFGYYLDRHLNLLSVSSFKYANIFFQFRLRPKNTLGYLWEFRMICDQFLFRQMRNYIKLTLFIITMEVNKVFSIYSFSIHCWQGFYNSFRKYIKSTKKFEYKYIDQNAEDIWIIDDASANKYHLYILIDEFEIEPRVKKYLQSQNIDLYNQDLYCRENIAQGSGEKDTFIQFPIDASEWIIQLNQDHNIHQKWLKEMCRHKLEAYFKMIKIKSAGTTNYSIFDNRLKHFEGYLYIYGTGKTDEEMKREAICGIRLQRNQKTHLFYTIEHGNLSRLGEDTTFTMNACNCYFGPGRSHIGQHKEEYKFQEDIWTKTTGESSFLTIGAQNRAFTNFIVTVFTQNGAYIGYKSQGFCMTIAGHGIRPPHLLWIEYIYRLCDIYRFVKKELITKASKHDKKCDRNKINSNVCKCIDPNNRYITSYDELPSSKDLNLS